jgi:integrase
MRVRLYLARPEAAQTVIFLTLREGTAGVSLQQMKISTGISIDPAWWDKRKQKLNPKAGPATGINRRLAEIHMTCIDLFHTATEMQHREPFRYVREQLEERGLIPRRQTHTLTALSLFETYIQAHAEIWSAATLKSLGSVRNALAQCIGPRDRPEVYVHPSTPARFMKPLKAKGLADSSLFRYVSHVRGFLTWAMAEGYLKKEDLPKAWEAPHQQRQASTVALSREEVLAISRLPLEGTLADVRRLFLAQCYSGLRYSDLRHLARAREQNGFLQVQVTKTSEMVSIPITPMLRALLAEGEMPDPITNKPYNASLRTLAEMAGITEMVPKIRWQGGRKSISYVPKAEMVTSHVARRTFITLSLAAGVPAELVMKVSGHRTSESFRKYVRLADAQVAQAMAEAWEVAKN